MKVKSLDKKEYGGIYLILNKINRKIYVGQTTLTWKKRVKKHFTKAGILTTKSVINTYFYNAVRKYGSENFESFLLCSCPDKHALDEAERFFIWMFASHKRSFGYNSTLGGDGVVSNKETREKIGNSNRGRKATPETREKQSKARLGKPMPPRTPEHAALLAAANRNRIVTQETRDKMSVSRKGKPGHPCSEEAREKIRKSKLGKTSYTPSEETRDKIRKSNSGKKYSPERVLASTLGRAAARLRKKQEAENQLLEIS
jgi:group I intron endonuclease